MAKYTPKSREELYKLVQDESIYLGDIDTSNITDMDALFIGSERRDFSGIESWDISNVTTMRAMFGNASYFNHNINSWNTSKVNNMHNMFNGATSFNKPLNNWDTSNVVNMHNMFLGAQSFNQSLDSWDISKVVDMGNMFNGAENFNQPLDSWDTSSVVNMCGVFSGAKSFNQPLGNWDTSSVEFMTIMFYGAESFNQNINSWDVSSVRDNQKMFWYSGINNLPKWHKKQAISDDLDIVQAEMEKCAAKAIANPRPKKPKIPPQNANKANDLSDLKQNTDSQKSSLKSKITTAFAIFFVMAICFNIFKSMLSDSDTKSPPTQTQQTQPTQQKQTQPQPTKSAQPTANMIRCDDKDLLNHLIKSYKNILIKNNANSQSFAYWQEDYRQHGINLTSIDELINSIKYNITNVRTKSSDEANREIVCEVKIDEIYPIPLKSDNTIDYRARLTDNEIEFEILDIAYIYK